MKQVIRTAIASSLALAATQAVGLAQQIYLNEIYASHSGTDFYEFIELKSAPNRSLDNIVVLIVEGDWSATSNEGTLDRVWDLTGYSTDANGYFLLGDTNLAMGAASMAPDFDIGLQDRLENGTNTFYVVDAGSAANVAALVAANGTDVDPDLDGITIIPTLSTILDSLGLVDGGINQVPPAFPDVVYDSAPIAGPDGVGTGAFLPGGVFRGLDAPNGWCADFLDFNEPGNQFEPRERGANRQLLHRRHDHQRLHGDHGLHRHPEPRARPGRLHRHLQRHRRPEELDHLLQHRGTEHGLVGHEHELPVRQDAATTHAVGHDRRHRGSVRRHHEPRLLQLHHRGEPRWSRHALRPGQPSVVPVLVPRSAEPEDDDALGRTRSDLHSLTSTGWSSAANGA